MRAPSSPIASPVACVFAFTVWVWIMILLAHIAMKRELARQSAAPSAFPVPWWPFASYAALAFMGLVLAVLGFFEDTRAALVVGVVWIGLRVHRTWFRSAGLIAIGIYSLLGLEVSTATVAAILTVLSELVPGGPAGTTVELATPMVGEHDAIGAVIHYLLGVIERLPADL